MRFTRTDSRAQGPSGHPRPPRWPRLSRFPGLFAILCFLLANCIMDGRQAGTSTSVTNPAALVTGFAILKDGSPAAGARVSLRKPIIDVSSAGVPTSRQVGYAVADAAGKFTVPLVYLDDVYMEIRESPDQRRGVPADSQELHLRRWPNGLPHDGKMGTFRLQPPGDLIAHIDTIQFVAGPSARRWVGVRGTDNFIAAPDKNPFTLKGVSAGHRELVLVMVPDTADWAAHPERKPAVLDSIVQGEVKSGSGTDFGPIFYYNF
ncbi:MAG: hypothetical protein JWP91_3372 [Fibrobacteres bacterium]|nr:hypothetical protein [Fibrobacterota bacterium]